MASPAASDVLRNLLRQELADFASGRMREELTELKVSLLQELGPSCTEPAALHGSRSWSRSGEITVTTHGRTNRHALAVAHFSDADSLGEQVYWESKGARTQAGTTQDGWQALIPVMGNGAGPRALSEVNHQPSLSSRLQRAVSENRLENGFGFLVCLSTLWVGFETYYDADTWSEHLPLQFALVDLAFGIAFTAEVSLKIVTFGGDFWCGPEWRWNWLDTLASISQLVEACLSLGFAGEGQKTQVSVLENLRYFRLARVVRVARTASAFPELRKLVTSVCSSLDALGWTMLLLVIVIYSFAILLTQLVSEHKISIGKKDMEREESQEELLARFGSFQRTILTLFMICSEGVHWGEVSDILERSISPWMALAMCFFVGFMLFAIMNIITAHFVETAMKNAAMMESSEITKELWQVFEQHNESSGLRRHDMQVGRDTFSDFAEHPKMMEYMSLIGVRSEDWISIFDILDVDGDGTLPAEEFIGGCAKLVGPARAEMTARILSLVKESREQATRHHEEAMAALRSLRGARPPPQKVGGTTQDRENPSPTE